MAVTGETQRLQPATPACPKCAGSMERGFVPDFAQGNQIILPMWVQGQPEPSFWAGYRTNNRPRFTLEAWRCPNCGFVEFYAHQPIRGSYP